LRKLRLLQIIETGGPGGAETVFLSLVQGLLDRGSDVECIVGHGSWLPQELERRGIRASLLTTSGSLDRGLLASLRRAIRLNAVDLVHAHLFEGALYASLAARLEGVPCVVTLHGQSDLGGLGLKASVKRLLFSLLASRVVSVSGALDRELAQALSMPSSRRRVITNGVRRQLPINNVKGEAGTNRSPRLVAIGNIRKPKDYPSLLSAISLVKQTHKTVHLDIAGEPDQDGLFESLAEQVSELSIQSNVTFHGFVADTSTLLAAADCFVLSSTQEGFSLATIEAMLAGVPVVATRSGGPEGIIRHEESGLLVPSSSPKALADAIVRILDDRLLATRCRETALAEAEGRYTLAAMVTSYENLYEELLADR
jgi:glycosyltransferase involved in cell wall biosynthesis